MTVLLVVAGILVALVIIFVVGNALGPPVKVVKFDETPADTVVLDTSDGIPLDLRYDPLAIDEGGCCSVHRSDSAHNISQPLTEEEQRRQLDRLREYIRSEGRR